MLEGVFFLLANSLFIIGLKAAFDTDNLLNPIKEGYNALLELFKIPIEVIVYFRKPLFSCVYCMSSFWGVVFLFLHSDMINFDTSFENVVSYVCVLCGWNYLVSRIIDK